MLNGISEEHKSHGDYARLHVVVFKLFDLLGENKNDDTSEPKTLYIYDLLKRQRNLICARLCQKGEKWPSQC